MLWMWYNKDMFVPWWGIGLVVLAVIYLIVKAAHFHSRIERLEKVLRRLEGISEDDLRKQIRDKMLQNEDVGR